MDEELDKKIQALLAEAMAKLAEVQKIVDEHSIDGPHVMFMNHKFVPSVGLMDSDCGLALSSEWNSSDCSIEGYYAWQSSSMEC